MYSHCTGPVLGMGPEMEPGSMAYPEFWKPVMSCVCVLRPVSVFCVLCMLGANTMLGAMENVRCNMEFINICTKEND